MRDKSIRLDKFAAKNFQTFVIPMSSGKFHNIASYTLRNKVRLIKGGSQFFELLLEMIAKSERSIHLQFYIFQVDRTGRQVINALKAASFRGVLVFLHIDAYASQGLSNEAISEMKEAGIAVKRFEPLLRSKHFYFGRRLHHKVVVVDGIYSLVGGRNVSDRYNDLPDEPAWMDMAVHCEGEASLDLLRICRQLWNDTKRLPAIPEELLENIYENIREMDRIEVRVRRNDWVKRKNQIYNSYLNMFRLAEDRITIMCSYFLPGTLFRRQMAAAVKRGVKVDVILAGISDINMAKHAERYLYDWMLKKGIGIYEYQTSILHAKVAAFDGKWATIGSYNVNNISAHASLELNLDIRDKGFVRQVEEELDHIMAANCQQITLENYKISTGFWRKIWQRICYLFINNVLKLFTFYFRQEE